MGVIARVWVVQRRLEAGFKLVPPDVRDWLARVVAFLCVVMVFAVVCDYRAVVDVLLFALFILFGAIGFFVLCKSPKV